MPGGGMNEIQEQLVLQSRLSELKQVPQWIAGLATRLAISEKIQYSMDVCLEEAISNVIRHGYAGREDRPVTVRFAAPREGYFEFAVEDEAPHFNPLEAPAQQALKPGAEMRVGGQGIRFLRELADVLEYETTPLGNRLRIGFSSQGSAPSTK
jgi:anti-sigma regulatory factor (Ser/Thr protein kinase)